MQSIEQAERLVEARASVFKRGLGVRWGIVLRERGDGVIGPYGRVLLVAACPPQPPVVGCIQTRSTVLQQLHQQGIADLVDSAAANMLD